MTTVRGFVIAGGQSKRLGAHDKTRLELAGVALIRRALDMALLVSSEVEVIADRWDRFSDLGISSLEDEGTDGPVAGWRRVLSALGDDEVACLIPVDLKTFSPSWVQYLVRVVQRTGRPSAFVSQSHWVEPYPCVIPGNVNPALLEKGMALRDALRAMRVMRVSRPDNFPDHPSLNTVESLQGAGVRLI